MKLCTMGLKMTRLLMALFLGGCFEFAEPVVERDAGCDGSYWLYADGGRMLVQCE